MARIPVPTVGSVAAKQDASTAATDAEVTSAVSTHAGVTTSVHGIANTALLETTAGAQSKADAVGTAAASALSTHAAKTTDAHGIPDTAALLTAESTGTVDFTARVAVMKDGSLIGTRRGLNLIQGANANLVVADDSDNERVNVTVSATGGGGDGMLGWINVQDYGADPTGVGDSTEAINNAITALPDVTDGGTIYFPPGTYVCSGTIDAFYNASEQTEKRGCINFMGASGRGYGQVNVPISKLIYTGEGERFIDTRSSVNRFQNLAILYESPGSRTTTHDTTLVAGSKTVISTTANFTSADVGKRISAVGIPVCARPDKYTTNVAPVELCVIASVTNSTTVEMNVAAEWTKGRTLTDVTVTSGSKTITSASGAFTEDDVGAHLIGTGIRTDSDSPTGSHIAVINSATSAEMNVAAKASGTNVTVQVGYGSLVIGGFQGSLIDANQKERSLAPGVSSGDTNGVVIENCLLSGYNRFATLRATSADCLVNFGNAIFGSVRNCTLIGARCGVRGIHGWGGQGMGKTYFANGIEIQNCEFAYHWGASILNPCQAWRIASCGFEGNRGELSFDTPGDVGHDRFIQSDDADYSSAAVVGMVVEACWIGDPGGSLEAETIFSNGRTPWKGVTIIGCQIAASNTDYAFRLGPGSIDGLSIIGNAISTVNGISIIRDAATPKVCKGLVVIGNNFESCIIPMAGLTTSNASRGNILILANRPNASAEPKSYIYDSVTHRAYNDLGSNPMSQWQNTSGTNRMGFASDAMLQWLDSALQTTTATAGAATLPANPLGFFSVKNAAGTTVKIPYYSA